jgi:hypothetical protein
VENIDGVIQNLLKINDSLNTQVSFVGCSSLLLLSYSKILPESDVSLPQDVADISAYPHQAHKRPVSLPYSEDERRLRNELAKIQEELTAAVLRAAEIERELPVEATNVSVSPDSSQLAELGEMFVSSSILFPVSYQTGMDRYPCSTDKNHNGEDSRAKET